MASETSRLFLGAHERKELLGFQEATGKCEEIKSLAGYLPKRNS